MENPKTIVDIFQQIILLKQLKGFFRRFVPSFFRNSEAKAFHILYQYFFIHLHKSSFRYIDRLNSSCRFWLFSIGQTLMWIQAHHVLLLSFGLFPFSAYYMICVYQYTQVHDSILYFSFGLIRLIQSGRIIKNHGFNRVIWSLDLGLNLP